MSFKILFIGEIVGKFGVYSARKGIKALRESHNIDFVIANANGATGGFGLGKNHSISLKNAGIDVLTIGDFAFFKKDLVQFLPRSSFILRPANLTPQTPGRGWSTYTAGDKKVTVINMLGPSGLTRIHPGSPYTYVPELISRVKESSDIIFLNFHSKTTAEKQIMFHLADGMAQAIIGTGARALTSDGRIMPKGTAIITDAGRTGSSNSAGGLSPDVEIEKLMTGIPQRSKDTDNRMELQGVLITFTDDNRAESIETLRIPIKGQSHEKHSSSS